MKKNKKKLLSITSSLFGISALCGLFSLSVFSDEREKIETKAEDYLIQTVNSNNINLYYHPDYITTNNVRHIWDGVDRDDGLIAELVTNNFTISYSVGLYQNNDGAVERYRLGFVFNMSNTISSFGSNPYTFNYLQDESTNISIFTDYINPRYFDFKLYLRACYVLYNETYSRWEFNVDYVVKLANDDEIVSYASFLYGRIDRNLGLDSIRSSYNVWPFTIQPTRADIYVGGFSFDAMATDYSIGYGLGYNVGYSDGYNAGNTQGYNNGYAYGFEQGVVSQQIAIDNAYNNGYSVGLAEGMSSDSTVVGIFSGILQIGMLPINMFLAMFNFNILGINVSSFISALLTVCITIIVVKTVMGGSSGGGKE